MRKPTLASRSFCALARAGICAEAQGRLADMEDALFANQRDHAPVESLGERIGLDLVRLGECLTSPDTDVGSPPMSRREDGMASGRRLPTSSAARFTRGDCRPSSFGWCKQG